MSNHLNLMLYVINLIYFLSLPIINSLNFDFFIEYFIIEIIPLVFVSIFNLVLIGTGYPRTKSQLIPHVHRYSSQNFSQVHTG